MGRGRLITTWLSRVLVASLVITSLILVPAKQAAAATGDPFRFIYDQSGRLVAAVTPTDVAKYTYDAVGNITAITRTLASAVAVIEFAPHSGVIGTTVTIYGSGFSTTPSQNTVKFNGITSTVTSSTTTQVVTTVPTGATSGTINVAAPGGNSTSSASFTVANLAPTITGFTPGTGVRGSSVTVTGTNFDTVLMNNNVRLNSTWAKVTAASATSLTFQVPPVTSSGPVSVATVNGKATGADFIIPPGTYTAADVGQSQRIDPGSTGTATVSTAGKISLVLFAATAGQRISINAAAAQNVGAIDFSIISPDGSTLWGPVTSTGSSIFTDALTITSGGTQTLVIDPQGTLTDSWTVSVYALPADFTAAITPTPSGVATAVAITVPGQNGHLTFSGTTGQRVSVYALDASWSIWFTIRNPDGTYAYGPAGTFNGTYWLEPVTLTQTGTYTIDIDPQGSAVGSRTFTVYDVPADFTAPITIGGSPVTVAIVTPGQNATLTFSASSGQRVSVSSVAVWSTVLGIRNPDNSYVYGPYVFNGNVATGTISLTQNGAYVIELDPISSGTGNQDFTLGDQGFGSLPIEIARDEPTLMRSGGADPATTRNAAGLTDPQPKDGPDGDDEWRPDPANPRIWVTNRPDSIVHRETPLYAANGVTALSGQVLALNGHALEGVQVAIGKAETTTDRNGQFLLSPLSPGHAVMIVNGTAEKANKKNYGMFEIGVDVADGRTNALPYTIWLPRIDDANAVAISSPTKGETIITTPSIPGLELHLPAGSTVKDMNGNAVTSISLTAIPLDRTPFPLPKFENIPIYFTIQPGCAYVLPKGAQIWYPNYTHLSAGTRVNFWSYDPDEKGWHVYGHGTVTEDESQVRPDADTFIYEFTGAMFGTIFNPPAWWAAVGDFFAGGDPVDLGSGLFVMDHTDLALPDVTPISLSRTYRQNDANNRGWGAGWSHPYLPYLWSAEQYQQVDLVLPDGGRVHYVRTSPGNGYADAVFEHTGTPSAFYKSHIVFNLSVPGWDLTLKDGTKLVFLDNGPLTLIVDRYGNRTSLVRPASDPKGNIDVIRSPNGRWIQLTYDSFNRITRAEDNSGRAVTYDYTAADATGKLWKVHDAAGGITEYGYDANGRLRTIKDPKLITYLTVDYDANGRVQTQTQADNTTFQFAYTVVNGKITQTDVTDPRTYVRRVTFNAAGYGVSDTAALGQSIAQTVSYERDPASNLVLSVTDPRSRVTRNTYYPSGDLWTTTSLYGTPDAVAMTFTYEPQFSQLASVTDPLTHATTFGYDANFNRISETDALQHATTFSYYGSGQLQTATNALQKTTTFTYEAGDLTTVSDPLGRVTKRFSDAIGRPLTVTDPLGNRVRTDYDVLNRITKVTDPKGNATQFTYDANGNRLTVKDAKNNITTYTYDNMDRLATRKDALLKTETYNSYDPNGNLLVVTDRKSQVTEFRYDALDRQSFAGFGRTGTSPNFSYQSTINYTYDNGNRLTIAADSVAGSVTRGYDELDRLTSEVTAQGTLAYQYDTASRRTQLTVTGQTTVTYGYDNADRLASITQGTTVIGFGYDNADRRTSLTMPGNLAVAYGYDDGSQLLSMTFTRSGSTIGDLAYTYDSAGRRATTSGSYARLNLPAAVTSATYNANNQLTKWGNTNLTYDLNGNMNGDGTNSYSWNSRDQLSAVTKSGQTLPSFTYDAFGRRQKKTLGAVVTSYLYDGANTVQELTGASPSANLLTGLDVDELFQRTEGATTRTVLADTLGSVIALADTAGVVQTSYTYAPYGATTVTGTASNSTSQFTSRENDGDGLYFYRARYYHPVMSRFVSEDPMGFGAGDPNVYAYAAGSPTNFTDPSGQCVPAAIFGAALDIGAFVMSGRKSEKTFGDWALLAGSIALDIACVGLIGKAIRAAGLVQRVSQLHHLLDDIKQAMTTTAALRAVASNGAARVIVASSDRYLPSVIKRALKTGEIAASGKGHAEITAIEKAFELGLKPVQIAASRGICPACRQRIAELGIKALTPFKE